MVKLKRCSFEEEEYDYYRQTKQTIEVKLKEAHAKIQLVTSIRKTVLDLWVCHKKGNTRRCGNRRARRKERKKKTERDDTT